MFITGHGIFPEKIALLKQLSGSANKLDNDYIESFGPTEWNSETRSGDKLCDQTWNSYIWWKGMMKL